MHTKVNLNPSHKTILFENRRMFFYFHIYENFSLLVLKLSINGLSFSFSCHFVETEFVVLNIVFYNQLIN
ncbi:hypothetical protein DZC41_03675 [Acinetobacter haemolyticus]|nr:hypothetical protein BSR56_07490 [Acinetobacter haemolyticus]NCU22589.1 hypothetical protein [Acinetobacter haemolyticus]